MTNKKGFELAVSNLVVIILGIVLFGIGIMIVSKIIVTGEDYQAKVDSQTQEQMERAMDDGSIVTVPRTRITSKARETVLIPYGFWNEGVNPTKFRADAVITPTSINGIKYLKDITQHFYEGGIPGLNQFPRVKANEKVTGLFGIEVLENAPSGQYAVDIKIYNTEDTPASIYGQVKRVYILVP